MGQGQYANDLKYHVHGAHRSLMCRIVGILSSRGVRMGESRYACHIPHAIADTKRSTTMIRTLVEIR
jgi:hypothetical protein